VPRRTNPFQQVIARVYQDLSDDAEESKPLHDRKAGKNREVDVVITEDVAGEKIRIGVEATDPKRKADLPTVEKLLGKHADLDTHHLIIVSKSGFTGPARRKVDETHSASFDLPERLLGTNIVDLVPSSPDFPLVDRELQEVATPGALFMEWANTNGQEMGELLDVQNVAEKTEKTLLKDDLIPPWRLNGEEIGDLYIMIDTNIDPDAEPTPEPLKVKRLDLRGSATIVVNKVDLEHQRLHSGIAYSVGETEIDSEPMLVVVGYTKKGERISTLRRA
jgi:hypothetical protein